MNMIFSFFFLFWCICVCLCLFCVAFFVSRVFCKDERPEAGGEGKSVWVWSGMGSCFVFWRRV